MSSIPPQHDPSKRSHGANPSTSLPLLSEDDGLDPANQSLADALRKSFGILKLVMLVLVVLYFLSGWFSVKPNEVGVVLRYGRVVGADKATTDPIRRPGWHWSWPYPFERWVVVPTSERQLRVEFMFQLTDEEKTGGIKGYRYENLSPLRDDYLITGDVNILHATLIIKYTITDAVAYLTNVLPAPAPGATVRSEESLRYPEFTLLQHLTRNAVIETAARREALEIRGTGQDEFLLAVARRINEKLNELEREGRSLGIHVDPSGGVLAPKAGGTVEAILPPRQVQEIFDRVFAAQSEKSSEITRAVAEAQRLLLETAGQNYNALTDAVDQEFDLMLRLSEATSQDTPESNDAARQLTEALAAQREKVESMLIASSGEVQAILKSAEIRQDQTVKEASGDYDQFRRLLPEYLRHPDIFKYRLREETYAEALANPRIGKIFVPEPPEGRGGRIWLKIPRVSAATSDSRPEDDRSQIESRRTGRQLGKGDAIRSAPTLVGP